MLDGRVKTLHPRISAGVLADLRHDDHRAAARRAVHRAVRARRREPVSVRGGGRAHGHDRGRADRADRHRRADARARRGQEPRQRRHRHRSGAVRRGAARAGPRPRPDDGHAPRARRGRLPADRRLRRADLGGAQPPLVGTSADHERGSHRRTDAGAELPPTISLELSRVQSLRYGENPHQAAALYRVSGVERGARARSATARWSSRASRCRTTTSSTRRPRPGWRATCAAPPASSSSTPTRAAPRRRHDIARRVGAGTRRRPGQCLRRRRCRYAAHRRGSRRSRS